MLELRRERAVGRAHRPAVALVEDGLEATGIDHWLDREDKAGAQPHDRARPAEMRHRWAFVELLPDTVAAPLAHDRVTMRLGMALDRMTDVAQPAAGLRRADAAPHRLFGYLQQPLRVRRHLADRVGHTGVAEPAVELGRSDERR